MMGSTASRRAGEANESRWRVEAFVVGLVILFVYWQQRSTHLPSLVLPSPSDTWARLRFLWGSGLIMKELAISLRRTLAGFGLAYVAALVAGIGMQRYRLVRFFLQPWLTAVQVVPAVIWLVLSVLWFGIAREVTPIFVVFIVCLPVVVVQVREGLAAIPRELLDLSALEPMGTLMYTRHVYLPALQPFLLSAATLGFSFAWRSVVFAEFAASSSGLGYQLSRSYHNLATDDVFAWTIVLVTLMWLWQGLVVERWRQAGNPVSL
jgi:NitT/TauT family transport system permease protein